LTQTALLVFLLDIMFQQYIIFELCIACGQYIKILGGSNFFDFSAESDFVSYSTSACPAAMCIKCIRILFNSKSLARFVSLNDSDSVDCLPEKQPLIILIYILPPLQIRDRF